MQTELPPSGTFGHPALRTLLWLKARGAVRAQFRKLRRPTAWIFLLVGLGLVSFWYLSIFSLGSFGRRGPPQPSGALFAASQCMMLLLTAMTVVSAFSHRGLYLPKEEIELCFSAPVRRSDLIRYRLLVNLLRSLLAGLVLGMISALRMPAPGFAFLGAMTAVATIPVVGQAAAILLGGTENQLAKAAQKLPLRGLGVVLALVLVALLGWALYGDDDFLPELSGEFPMSGSPLERLAGHPLARIVLAPFTPWAAAMTARDVASFLPWFGVCLAIWYAAFELTARIPVDFRELSLATSADVARRIQRARRGFVGASAGEAARGRFGRSVPWLFGRGPFGAVAWLKLGQIVRKARGTLLVSALIVVLITTMTTMIVDEAAGANVYVRSLGGAGLLAGVGTLYLCLGLRFDFRADLELMSSIKTWPLPPRRLFLATILPEVALVTALLWTAVLVRAVWTGTLLPDLWLVLALQPLVTFTWAAIDNTVFLFSPVRYNPGQEGALQHIGRSILLLGLRGIVFGLVLGLAAAPITLLVWWGNEAGWSVRAILAGSGAVLAVVLLIASVLLTLAGGTMLRRFDVARDRG